MPCNKTGSNSFQLGRKFTIQTDHRSLEWLDRLKDSNPRLCRWSLGLQPYQYTVVQSPGKANENADSLTHRNKQVCCRRGEKECGRPASY